MKNVAAVIVVATLYLIFFQLTPYLPIKDNIVIAFFIFSPFVVVYMAYVILKYGKPSGHTFDERFYDDYDYRKISD